MKLVLIEELNPILLNEGFTTTFVDKIKKASKDLGIEDRNTLYNVLNSLLESGIKNSVKFVYDFIHALLGGKNGDHILRVIFQRLPSQIFDYIKPIIKVLGFDPGLSKGADIRSDSAGAMLGSMVRDAPRMLPIFWR